MKLLLRITELGIQLVCTCCLLGYGIKEPEYALCCQSNKTLEKTEVGPYLKYEYT